MKHTNTTVISMAMLFVAGAFAGCSNGTDEILNGGKTINPLTISVSLDKEIDTRATFDYETKPEILLE